MAIVLFVPNGFSASTYTTNIGIPKPADGDTGWGTTIRQAFDIIDSSMTAIRGESTQSFYLGTDAGTGLTGTGNLALGYNAYATPDNLTLGRNLAIGTNALLLGGGVNIGTNGDNMAIGHNALSSLEYTSGLAYENTAIGSAVMQNSVDSYANVAIGYLAMSADLTGGANTAIGVAALSATTGGSGNTAIGYNAGGGDENHVAGRDTMDGTSNTTLIGANSTALHPLSVNPFATPTNTIAIGYHATSECTDCVVFGATDISRPMRLVIGSTSVSSTMWLNSKHSIASGANSLPAFDGYSLKITTADVVNQYDLAVDSQGVVTPRILQLTSKTAAQIRALVPTAVGQVYYCSDCATVPTCISTGTAVNQTSLSTSKATACS
jgi:hypothetical protein